MGIDDKLIKENILNKIEKIKFDRDNYRNYQLEEDIKEKITEVNKNDFDFFVKLIEFDPTLIKYASKELKDNEEFVLKALERENEKILDKQWPRRIESVFKHASDRLKNDKEVVINAINENSYAVNYIGEDLKHDIEFIKEIIKNNNVEIDLWYFPEKIRDDKEIVMVAVKNDTDNFYSISNRLKDDKEFILETIKLKKDEDFNYISNRLKNDKEVVTKIMQNNHWYMINRAGKELINDIEFIKEITEINPIAFTFVDYDTRMELIKDMEFRKKVIISTYENDDWQEKGFWNRKSWIKELKTYYPEFKNTISEYEKEIKKKKMVNENPWNTKEDKEIGIER